MCQTDSSTVLRHTIKALVKEPALSDGRIRPGDKLISANGQNCASFSHTELISYLRKIGNSCDLTASNNTNSSEEIELRLYRDSSESHTPISPSTEKLSEESDGIFIPHQSNLKTSTMSHPNLPSFLSTSNFNSATGSNAKTQKRLRHEAKEMV